MFDAASNTLRIRLWVFASCRKAQVYLTLAAWSLFFLFFVIQLADAKCGYNHGPA
jgi:hypothetical protein